jgi:hypothetical protein
MSRANYANIATDIATTEIQDNTIQAKPVLVRPCQKSSADWATRRVAEVVELELANGSLPA